MNNHEYDIGKYNKDAGAYEKIIKELFDRNPPITLSSEYAHFIEENTLHLLIRLARYKFAARLIKNTDTVLEVGSGTGVGSLFLSQHAKQVVGLEIKQSEVEEAKGINRRDNVTFLCQDFFEYQPETPVDTIVALDVIEHLTPELGEKMIARMAEIIQPNGMIIVGSPSIYSYAFQSPQSQASHIHCYDQKELVNVIERYFGRTLAFSMNDEIVHTGFPKLAWYYFVIGLVPKRELTSGECGS